MISLFFRRLVWVIMGTLIGALMLPFLLIAIPIATLHGWVYGELTPFKNALDFLFEDNLFFGPMPERLRDA